MLYRENRLIGKANLDWQLDRYNRLKLGGEFTHYDIDSYSFQLESQAFSDFYHREADPLQPVCRRPARPGRRGGGRRPPLRLLRHPGRVRWNSFPRISTNPLFDPNNPDAFFTNDSLVPQGSEPQLPEPAHPGLLPGDRADQLPAVLLPPGAGARTSA